jgi:hypothetical protein
MNKRKFKKQIRKVERMIAREIYEFSKDLNFENQENFNLDKISWLFAIILWQHLVLSDWNNKEKWIDGLINGKLIIKLPNSITLRGEMVWGLVEDVGGEQWKEPFEASAKISQDGKKIISYTIKFASHDPIEKK